jgi:hypothetical protein
MTAFNSHRYGYSTMLIYVGDEAAWGHTGSLRGYVAATLFVPTSGITVSVLVNRGRIKPLALARELTLTIEAWLSAQPAAA